MHGNVWEWCLDGYDPEYYAKSPTNDPIVAEVRAIRDEHAARFGYDIKEIFESIRAQQRSSGREYVRYPARPSSATTSNTSTE